MSAAPWSVKGIDPKAREVAKDLARRSGMTLGDWLNSMIMEDEEDDGDVVPMPRRAQAPQTFDRRGRNRRLTDAYADDQIWMRISASVDAIGQRLEAAEQRSTAAIQGVDQAVAGLVRRLDGQEQVGKTYGRRLDDIAEELKEGHKRLRYFEHEAGPKTSESLGKVEGSIGGIASRLYDIEERQRSSVNELRQRMETVEKAAGPGAGSDRLNQVGQRLDEAQGRTSEALRSLERSFADLDRRLRDAEGRVEPEGAREAARFEKLAESLSRQVESNRLDMMRRLDTVETEGRLERIERAVQAMTDQLKASEERSARAVEAMGQEVLRIAQNLNGRVGLIETGGAGDIGQEVATRVRAEVGRVAQSLEQRLTAADDRHAIALEKLGGEITRISDRLSERIAQSEQRSAQALDDIGRRLSDSSSRIEQRYDRASGELAERMRMSEERTATLIAEARTTIDRRSAAPKAVATAPAEPDWRAAAFPDSAFPDPEPFPTALPAMSYEDDAIFAEQKAWSADLAPPEPVAEVIPEPEPLDETDEPAFEASPAMFAGPTDDGPEAETPTSDDDEPADVFGAPSPSATQPAPFGQGFGGADVSDALAATAPDAFDDADDDFDGETEFVDQRALRAAAAKGRASASRDALSAVRATMVQAEPAAKESRSLLSGLKRGGKSRLQERLDKQTRGSGTVGKAFGASVIAVALTAGGVLATNQLTGSGPSLGDLVGGEQPTVQPIAALATTDALRPADLQKGAQLYRQAIEQLDGQETAGVETLKQAAALGYAPAQLHLAGLYQDGAQGVDIDPVQARTWAKRAADAGDARGMHAYGMYLFDGVGGAQDRGEALAWLKRAADKGLIDSQFNVAKLYETGDKGIPADPTQAFKWYLIAARAGDTDAEAAVDRLRGELPATARGEARAEADRFQVQPLG